MIQLPKEKSLLELLAEVECVLQEGDSGRALALLRELVAWVGTKPTPAERVRIAKLITDPSMTPSLVSVPVVLQRAFTQGQTPQFAIQGDHVVAPLLLVFPLSLLQVSRIALATGVDPLGDMVPVMDARMILPGSRLRPEFLATIQGERLGSQDN